MAEGTQRRLAAIVSADVVGYSRLIGVDESGTLDALRKHRAELIDLLIAEHGGRIVKTMGDGLLLEFPSVVNAVKCSIEVQLGMFGRNAGIPNDKRVEFRIGVNLGDIVIEGDDIHGDGVNVAARLQGASDAVGLALSGVAYESLGSLVDAAFADGGQQRFKNITRPVHVWRWIPTGPASAGETTAVEEHNQQRPPKPEAEGPPLPDGPSVAVLPFENKSGDPDQDYFSDGLTENIISGLSRFREILVIGVKSILIAREKTNDVRVIGRSLGVAHIVEGSVRKAGDRVRISAQLVDAASGQRLWAEYYDRKIDDIFAVQDEITNIIVASLAGQIEHLELARVMATPAEDIAAYDCQLRGRQCLNRYTQEGELEARHHFERALELNPESAAAYAGLSISYCHEYEANWSEVPEKALERAYGFAQQAVALDEANSPARYAIASVYYYRGQPELAKVHMEKALELNPNDYHNLCNKGWFLALSDRTSESIACSTQAMRINPLVPDNCLFAIGIAEFCDGKYEDALAAFGKVRGWGLLRPAWIAACYAQLGRDAQAKIAAAEVRELAPSDPSVPSADDIIRWRAYWARLIIFENPEKQVRFFEGLRKAGLPA